MAADEGVFEGGEARGERWGGGAGEGDEDGGDVAFGFGWWGGGGGGVGSVGRVDGAEGKGWADARFEGGVHGCGAISHAICALLVLNAD